MRKTLSYFALALLLFLSSNSGNSAAQFPEKKNTNAQTGTFERMLVANGNVTMNLDLNRLNGSAAATNESKLDTFHWGVSPNSFFTIRVFNNFLQGPEAGSMALISKEAGMLPEPLRASVNQLVVEKMPSSESSDLAVRDGKTGFVFFTIKGHTYDYDARTHLFGIRGGTLLISEALANKLGRPADAGGVAGEISIRATVYPIEVTTVVNGAAKSSILPAREQHSPDAAALVSGPDIVVGDLSSMIQLGSSGTQVGLSIGVSACNNGDTDLDFFALPNADHPVLAQNLYRMSGGATHDDRFEQVGQSWLRHLFSALEQNDCGFGCTPSVVGGTHLGAGCSDAESASSDGAQTGLGSRAWVNPLTGVFPGSNPNPADHSGHTHTGVSHRILVESDDLNTTLNSGATYYAEVQCLTPHEYAWCQAHGGQCNVYNNVSYRRFNVSGTTSFVFSAIGSTVRTAAAITAWTGATINTIEPAPGVDGRAFVGYKVTNPSAGVWHYEYALYNENLDRAIQSFSVPLGCGVTISNPGFHAPLNPPGFANDGTQGDAGFSNTPWTSNQTADAVSWNTETFAQNQNANAIRFGTLYNFRFDSNRPPEVRNATIGFFKTGSPITVAIQGPSPCNPLQIVSAVSRKTHGAAGDFDVDLPLTGEPGVECRSTGGNHTLVVTFSNSMISGSASVVSGVGNVAGSPSFNGNTMTIGLTSVADMQKITVTLSNVTDSFAQVMPDTSISVNILAGDTTGNKMVNSSDVTQTKLLSAAPVTIANFRSDVTANGAINSSDISEVKADSGHSLP